MNNLTRKGAVHDILLGSLRHKVRGISLAQDTVHVQELHHLVDLRGVGVGDQAGKPQLVVVVVKLTDVNLSRKASRSEAGESESDWSRAGAGEFRSYCPISRSCCRC